MFTLAEKCGLVSIAPMLVATENCSGIREMSVIRIFAR
jgi:hypothetical protein